MPDAPALDDVALACLFSGHERVDGLRALHEWAGAMDELVRLGTTRSHDVAHHKLQWWREELDRLAQGAPRHPLTQRLRTAAPEAGLWNWLPERLELLQFELAGVAPDDTAAAERWDWRREGVLQATALQLLIGSRLEDGSAEMTLARGTGRLLGRLVATECPARHAARGRLGLPLEALEAAGLPLAELPEALGEARFAECLRAVLEGEWAHARNAASEALAAWRSLPAGRQRDAAVPVVIRLRLAERRLSRLARHRGPLSEPLPATPWRSLWLAWRTARHAASG